MIAPHQVVRLACLSELMMLLASASISPFLTGKQLLGSVGETPSSYSSTAAIHMYDGSVTDIWPVSAQSDYISLLSHQVEATAPPPLTKYQQCLRWINKKLGRPSTPEVGIPSTLIKGLTEKIVALAAYEGS